MITLQQKKRDMLKTCLLIKLIHYFHPFYTSDSIAIQLVAVNQSGMASRGVEGHCWCEFPIVI